MSNSENGKVEIYKPKESTPSTNAPFPTKNSSFFKLGQPSAQDHKDHIQDVIDYTVLRKELNEKIVDLDYSEDIAKARKEAELQQAQTELYKKRMDATKIVKINEMEEVDHELSLEEKKARIAEIKQGTRVLTGDYEDKQKSEELKRKAFEERMNRKPPEPVSASFLPIQVVRWADEIIKLENQEKENQTKQTSDETLFRKIQVAYKELELLCNENGINSNEAIHRVRNAT